MRLKVFVCARMVEVLYTLFSPVSSALEICCY